MPITPSIEIDNVVYSFPSIPLGGTTGQVLTKASNTDLDVTWSATNIAFASDNDYTSYINF